MSRDAVEQVIGRLVSSAEFRKAMGADPASALAPFDLTAEERKVLVGAESADWEKAASGLDERLSKWFAAWCR